MSPTPAHQHQRSLAATNKLLDEHPALLVWASEISDPDYAEKQSTSTLSSECEETLENGDGTKGAVDGGDRLDQSEERAAESEARHKETCANLNDINTAIDCSDV